jgi:hypothetical protein
MNEENKEVKKESFGSKLLRVFSVRELTIVVAAILVSVALVVAGATYQKPGEEEPRKVLPLFPSKHVYDVNGVKRPVFDTSFYVGYESTISEDEQNGIISVLDEYLLPYHKLFDRHAYYYAVDPVDPKAPTEEEKATLPRLNNLRVLNDNIDNEIEIDKPLYEVLSLSKDLMKMTNGSFNIYIGKLYDYWTLKIGDNPYEEYDASIDPINNVTEQTKLDNIVSYVPKTLVDIDNTLVLRSENNHYYATLKSFNGAGVGDLAVSLGAIAKGYMSDVLEGALLSRGYYRGYINGGQSSWVTLNSSWYGGSYPRLNMASIIPPYDNNYGDGISYSFNINGKIHMSTSGTYTGKRFTKDGVTYLRNHIIDPNTGYPANNAHELVNLISPSLSSAYLDALTTSLIVLGRDEGVNLLKSLDYFADNGLAYLSLETKEYYMYHNEIYPGKNTDTLAIYSPYREKIIE